MTIDQEIARLWTWIWPVLVLTGTGLLAMMSSVFGGTKRMAISALIATLGLAIAGAGFFCVWHRGEFASLNYWTSDPFSNFLSMLVCAIGVLTTIFSFHYWKDQAEQIPEVFCLFVFAVLGMVIMVSTTHLLTFVLGLEVMSLSLYILVGSRRLDLGSSEAAFKYFLLGSVATAFLLFGISLTYGVTATLDFKEWGAVAVSPDLSLVMKMGGLLLLMGFAFKVAAVPFHFWAPDAYDGAPMPVTGFMATGVKVAAFGALIRVLQALVHFEMIPLQKFLLGLSLATMLVGNLTALRQKSLKRILAYSSISHAGYLLLGLATLVKGNAFVYGNMSAILFYLASYSLLTLGAFGILTLLSASGKEVETLQDLAGLAENHPVLSALFSVFLISLAGIPPTAGFVAKYFLFSQAVEMGFYPFAILGILSSAISLFYYLGPVVQMYFREPGQTWVFPRSGAVFRVLMLVMLLSVFYLGLLPARPFGLAVNTKIFIPDPSRGPWGSSQSLPSP